MSGQFALQLVVYLDLKQVTSKKKNGSKEQLKNSAEDEQRERRGKKVDAKGGD